MSEDVMDFQSDADLNPVSGTKVLVQIRLDDEGTPPDLNGKETQYGLFVPLQMEVVEGELRGNRASLSYNLDPKNAKFRKIILAVTGIDVSEGGRVSLSEFNEKFLSGVFEAEIGPEVRKGEKTGYTAVEKLISRVRDRDASASSEEAFEPAAIDTGTPDTDDIPF